MHETSRRTWSLLGSLERRLPLTIGALLAAVVLVLGFAAFREVRLSAREQASKRLDTVSQLVLRSLQDNIVRRGRTLLAASRSEWVARAIASNDAASRTAVLSELALLKTRGDSALLGIELRGHNGRAIVSTSGDSVNSLDESAFHSLLAAVGNDSIIVGPFYSAGSELHYWVLVPVLQSSVRTGFIAERRRFTANRAEAQLQELTGQNIELFFTSANGERWADADGQAVDAPFDLRETASTFSIETVHGESMLGLHSPVRGTPWSLVYMIPDADITARASALLRRTVPFALGVLVVGAFAGWLITRAVTRPLRQLATASDAIASGDYSLRVAAPQDEELRQLASAFNRMAERVGASHHELEARNEELRAAQEEAVAARELSDAARLEAQRANEAKTSFLAMMSHELRTPLSAIGGYTEILQLGLRGPLTETQVTDLERIKANQVHLLTIINDMLDLSQIESGQLSVHCESVVLHDVLQQVEPIVAPHIARKRVIYEVDASVKSHVVFADRERLRQVLVNLVSNAARYSEAGGVIHVHASARDGRVAVSVSDTGIGIPAEKLDAIFEPFVQVDAGPTRKTGGTGLGLPISRRLAEAMEGTLFVSSTVGVGSTFTLDLRAADVVVQRPDLRLVPGRLKQTA